MALAQAKTDCPDEEKLRLLARGAMPPLRFDSLCEHVETCLVCQKNWESLREEKDGLVASIQSITPNDLANAKSELDSESRAGLAKTVLDLEYQEYSDRPTQAALNPPCELGPYDVNHLIAQGGMGEIYQARHKRLGRSVALKVIRGHRLNDPVIHQYFLREMANAGKLDHPNLVRALDAWEADGCLYLAFELLEGKTLQQILDQGNDLSLLDVCECLRGICSGLDHLHSQNLVHCDLKPSNIMRIADGTIKLIDIGLARSTEHNASPHTPGAGTKGYIAPEAEKPNYEIDKRSDLYSLGRLLEFMLDKTETGETNRGNITLRQELGKIARKLTRTDPEDRYQNINQVINDLEGRGSFRAKKPNFFTKNILLIGVTFFTVFCASTLAPWLPRNQSEQPDPKISGIQSRVGPIPMKMATLPAGSFMMGAVENDPDAKPDECPRRKVEFKKPFRMGIAEVTVGQFREFVNATGYKTEAESSGKGGWKAGLATSWAEQYSNYHWANPGYPIGEDLPVTMVTYQDAMAFCDWLGKRDGCSYRLPTEAEWEYACRAGSESIYPFPIESRDMYSWSSFNIKASLSPRPVGTKTANAWGLVDTVGNVREWCLDWYSDSAYQTAYSEAPSGPPKGNLRAVRGACFMDKTGFMRSSKRGYHAPDQAINNQGFRVVIID